MASCSHKRRHVKLIAQFSFSIPVPFITGTSYPSFYWNVFFFLEWIWVGFGDMNYGAAPNSHNTSSFRFCLEDEINWNWRRNKSQRPGDACKIEMPFSLCWFRESFCHRKSVLWDDESPQEFKKLNKKRRSLNFMKYLFLLPNIAHFYHVPQQKQQQICASVASRSKIGNGKFGILE